MATEPYVNQFMASSRQSDPEKMQSGCYGKHRLGATDSIAGKFGGIYAITDCVVDLVSRELPGMLPWGTRNADGSYDYDDMTAVSLVAGEFLPGPFISVDVTSGDVGVFDWGPQF